MRGLDEGDDLAGEAVHDEVIAGNAVKHTVHHVDGAAGAADASEAERPSLRHTFEDFIVFRIVEDGFARYKRHGVMGLITRNRAQVY